MPRLRHFFDSLLLRMVERRAVPESSDERARETLALLQILRERETEIDRLNRTDENREAIFRRCLSKLRRKRREAKSLRRKNRTLRRLLKQRRVRLRVAWQRIHELDTWAEEPPAGARHAFSYQAEQVSRFLEPAARLAKRRRGRLTVVWKESGLPSISVLWKRCAHEAADRAGVAVQMVDVDLFAYQLVQTPRDFDVVAAPNLFGDILGDLGAAFLGARGHSYSGNFSGDGKAAYQTNHGSAHDIARLSRANPAGQIFSMAMMLRESFGLWREAARVEAAVRSAWADGWRTADVATPGCRLATTGEMAAAITEHAGRLVSEC